MARKRVTAEAMAPAPEGSRVLVYRREPEASDLYRVSAWHGVPHFECNLCAFDTLVASNMLAHLESHGAGRLDGSDVADMAVTAGSEPVECLEIVEVEDNGNSGEE